MSGKKAAEDAGQIGALFAPCSTWDCIAAPGTHVCLLENTTESSLPADRRDTGTSTKTLPERLGAEDHWLLVNSSLKLTPD